MLWCVCVMVCVLWCVCYGVTSHMGLGKTLQSLCLIAGDHHSKSRQYEVCTKLQTATAVVIPVLTKQREQPPPDTGTYL